MFRNQASTLWSTLRQAWLAASLEVPADPRLAEEAGYEARQPRRTLSPLVGAWLR